MFLQGRKFPFCLSYEEVGSWHHLRNCNHPNQLLCISQTPERSANPTPYTCLWKSNKKMSKQWHDAIWKVVNFPKSYLGSSVILCKTNSDSTVSGRRRLCRSSGFIIISLTYLLLLLPPSGPPSGLPCRNHVPLVICLENQHVHLKIRK